MAVCANCGCEPTDGKSLVTDVCEQCWWLEVDAWAEVRRTALPYHPVCPDSVPVGDSSIVGSQFWRYVDQTRLRNRFTETNQPPRA